MVAKEERRNDRQGRAPIYDSNLIPMTGEGARSLGQKSLEAWHSSEKCLVQANRGPWSAASKHRVLYPRGNSLDEKPHSIQWLAGTGQENEVSASHHQVQSYITHRPSANPFFTAGS